MKKYFKTLIKSVWVVQAVLVLASCKSDVWEDHYSYKTDGNSSVSTLAETIESLPGCQNFVKALKETYMYNYSGEKLIRLTYWDLLSSDQFFTVWVPKDDSMTADEWAPYIKSRNDASKDHGKVGTQFILNHIARFSQPVGSDTTRVKMMSEKTFISTPLNIAEDVAYDKSVVNMRCTNGILHCIEGSVPYRPSIYEYITGLSPEIETAGHLKYDYDTLLGDWFKKFTLSEVDEKRSVAYDIDDEGQVIYVDKVVIKSSVLMKKFGFISTEDSNYALVLPTPDVWRTEYDSVKKYYEYAVSSDLTQYEADSLSEFWTKSAMLTDMFFNMNKKIQRHKKDSVTSTLFTRAERMSKKTPYHVYYAPYDSTGLFSQQACIDSVICSNGIIYIKDFWPYQDSLTFRTPIKINAVDVRLSGVTTNPRGVNRVGTRVFNNHRIMEVSKTTAAWDADYVIDDYLKGKYLVKIVIFPNSVIQQPNLVHPKVTYTEETATGVKTTTLANGEKKYKKGVKTYLLNDTTGKDMTKIDTIVIGPIEIPSCSYKTPPGKVNVNLASVINNANQDQFTNKVWLDCIIFEPVFE